jgi:hypothetical protein
LAEKSARRWGLQAVMAMQPLLGNVPELPAPPDCVAVLAISPNPRDHASLGGTFSRTRWRLLEAPNCGEALVFFLGHVLYKGSLFLAAGTTDHGAGTADIRELGGLRRAMPANRVDGGGGVVTKGAIVSQNLMVTTLFLIYRSSFLVHNWGGASDGAILNLRMR